MNILSQVITGIKFNCTTAMQGAHQALHLNSTKLLTSKRRTSQRYGATGSKFGSCVPRPSVLSTIPTPPLYIRDCV